MRKLVLFLEAGIGAKEANAYLVPEDTAQFELDHFAWSEALSYAEYCGIYPESGRPEYYDEDEDEDFSDEHSDGIEGWWEEYDANKHDAQLICGDETEIHWNAW